LSQIKSILRQLSVHGISIIVLIAFCLAFHNAFPQRKYYEYNNPEALKLTSRRIEMLTSAEWQANEMHLMMRGDKYTYRHRETISYKPDGTYAASSLEGNWKIVYNRYLVHTPTSQKVPDQDHSVVGIYSITSINDSILTLTKLHSSTRDMTTRISFVKQTEERGEDGRLSHALNSVSERRRLSDSELDSLRFLSKEELFIKNWSIKNDTLYVPISDTLYRISMNSDDPLRRVKVFSEDENVNYFVNAKRFTPPSSLVSSVDSLAMDFIRTHREDYSGPEISDIKPYFRQYIGYDDGHGNRVIYLNAFCRYHRDWKSKIVSDPCHFRIYVNVTKNECFGLHVD
jgi:hypothetical protein